MEKELIYSIPSMFRQDFRIQGYRFGSGKKALAVVGSLRGNEYQQLYTCAKLMERLKELEAAGALTEGNEILIIPSLNPGSMNIEKRFWPTDNTDINRMFPGYNLGETTQRIAAGVFERISAYENGIQFASFYMPGRFCPHVRIMKTGYENVEKARQFGLPYIVLKVPKPYDTTTLNYNWQIWETDAFSLYGTTTQTLDENSADLIVNAILRFLEKNGLVKENVRQLAEGGRGFVVGFGGDPAACGMPGAASCLDGGIPAESCGFFLQGNSGSTCVESRVVSDRELTSVRPKKAGFFKGLVEVGETVRAGQTLALILDSHDCGVLEELKAPRDGVVFFEHDKPLIYADTAALKLL